MLLVWPLPSTSSRYNKRRKGSVVPARSGPSGRLKGRWWKPSERPSFLDHWLRRDRGYRSIPPSA